MPTPVVPVAPDRGLNVERQKTILLFTADDGSRESRVKRTQKLRMEMVYNNHQKKDFLLTANLATMQPFWNAYYDGATIVQCTHPYTGEVLTGWIDSNLKEKWDMQNLVSFSWIFQEA